MNAIAETMRLTLSAAIAASGEARACTERLAGRTLAFESMEQRFVVHFEAGAVRVETEGGEADATVRGSPGAVFGALAGSGSETAAVLGDTAVFEDFRASFRPHVKLPPVVERFAEDAGDAARTGVQAARSAFEGFANTAKDYLSAWPGREDAELAELRAAVQALTERVERLEKQARGESEGESKES